MPTDPQECLNTLSTKILHLKDYVSRVDQIWKKVQNYGKAKVTLFEFARQNALSLRSEFTHIQQECMSLNMSIPDTHRRDVSKYAGQIDDLIEAISVACAEAVDFVARSNAQAAQISDVFPPQLSVAPPTPVRLKPVEIEKFSNDILDFPRFIRLFESIYDKHTTLTNTEKFYYLQQSLQGDALTLVNTFDLTDAGYTDALKALKDRYSSPRILASTITSELLSFLPAKRATPDSLRQFLRVYQDHVSILKSMANVPDLSDFLLLTIACKSLDAYTRKLFESRMAEKTTFPTYKDLISFVTQQVTTLELITPIQPNNVQNEQRTKSTILHVGKQAPAMATPVNQNHRQTAPHRGQTQTAQSFCIYCSSAKDHKIGKCPTFSGFNLQARVKWATESKRCNVCLSSKHTSNDCQSTGNCVYCQSKQHNSLLCPTKFSTTTTQAKQEPPAAVPGTSSAPVLSCTVTEEDSNDSIVSSNALLGTFLAKVPGSKSSGVLRCVLDTGSVQNLITLDAVRFLGLQMSSDTSILAGVGGKQLCTLGCVQFSIYSMLNPSFSIPVNASVIPKITDDLPPVKLDHKLKQFLSSIKLADSELLDGKSTPVHILLSISSTMKILSQSLSPAPLGCDSTLYSLPTPFGHVISGYLTDTDTQPSNCLSCTNCAHAESKIKDFFYTESMENSEPTAQTADEIYAESHFVETHYRAPNGKFIVRLPFKPDFPELGVNKPQALAFFFTTEKKMRNDPAYYACYQTALQDFFDKKEIIPSNHTNNYLLNQHIVYKKANNKAKIVFNPAVKAGKHSFNDSLLQGPKLQRDINYVLIAARAKPVALACDIDNFYRSIGLHPDDGEKIHIMARLQNSTVTLQGNVTECAIQHLCYGLTSAPFLALRCVNQIIDEENQLLDKGKLGPTGESIAPASEAIRILSLSRYVDDIFFSADNIDQCAQLKKELCTILAKGNFSLGKFVSSHSELEPNSQINPILGLIWDPATDTFKFKFEQFSGAVTRRSCTSFLAKCYDSQGLISPVIFYLKRFVQLLWHEMAALGWDKPIPQRLADEWLEFMQQIHLVHEISIPRFCTVPEYSKQYLVIFSDASNSGYASCAYVVTTVAGKENVSHLIFSKSKLAPLKTVRTIPQLELAGIELSAKIINWLLAGDLPFNFEAIYGYSDSMIALAYLNIPVNRLKTYVANRVSHVHTLTEGTNVQWLYCPTKANPADLASRGCSPSVLSDSTLWFQGPSSLKTNFPPNDADSVINENLPLPDVKQTVLISPSVSEPDLVVSLSEKFSTLCKLQRVMSYVRRFIHNCRIPKSKESERKYSALSYQELNDATMCIVKHVQGHAFPVKNLSRNGSQCPSDLISLTPFVDQQGFVRVGGRLANSNLPYKAKHPLLLPKKCNFSYLLCRHFHILAAHGGSNLSTALMRNTYWVVSGKQLMRSLIHSCVTCAKWHPKSPSPIQGQLPSFRMESTFPFRHTVGLDCFGPYLYKVSPRRNSASDKLWGLIFVCEATRASHIEILTSMSAKHFLAAVDRFTSRRGVPVTFRSDCGTNFTAGFKKMSEMQQWLNANVDTIVSDLATRSIQFQNIPAYSPWLGSWEPLIKCCKKLLNTLITYPMYFEEFYTTFTKVESLLNSRPYLEPSNDTADLLSPAHFLVGGPFATAPIYITQDDTAPTSLHCRWERITQLVTLFWRKWHREVLHTLMQSNKWPKGSSDIQVNQLVWVPDTKSLPGSWPIGQVSKLYPDKGGQTRVCDVRMANGSHLRRSIRNLVLIPIPPAI